MTWDAHTVLHQPGSTDECVECAINDRHKQRIKAVLEETGDPFSPRITSLMEENRQEWVAWDNREINEPTVRHDKPKKFDHFVSAHHGETVTIHQIMEEVGCAQGTVYNYIREMALAFRRVGTSTYLVIDRSLVREETLTGSAPTVPQERPNTVAVVSSANTPSAVLAPTVRPPSKP